MDPAPDIAVEVDVTSESLSRFHIYASLGLPELWRYDEAQFEIYHLVGTDYVASTRSLAFPFLTSEVLFRFLERSRNEGQSAALRAFRESIRANHLSSS